MISSPSLEAVTPLSLLLKKEKSSKIGNCRTFFFSRVEICERDERFQTFAGREKKKNSWIIFESSFLSEEVFRCHETLMMKISGWNWVCYAKGLNKACDHWKIRNTSQLLSVVWAMKFNHLAKSKGRYREHKSKPKHVHNTILVIYFPHNFAHTSVQKWRNELSVFLLQHMINYPGFCCRFRVARSLGQVARKCEAKTERWVRERVFLPEKLFLSLYSRGKRKMERMCK